MKCKLATFTKFVKKEYRGVKMSLFLVFITFYYHFQSDKIVLFTFICQFIST